MLVHVRLSKFYAAAGQSDLSALQIGEALRRASQDRTLQSITDATVLSGILARIDKGAMK